jgi:hypothetical protein
MYNNHCHWVRARWQVIIIIIIITPLQMAVQSTALCEGSDAVPSLLAILLTYEYLLTYSMEQSPS